MSVARILVVDDEPSVRYFIEETLSYNGHQVVAADNGQAALDLIAREDFDLAVLDLKMDGVSGLDVLSALREHSPCTSAIVLTGHGSLDTAIEAIRQGAHDYLLKPCDPDQLRQSVQVGLDRRQLAVQYQSSIQFTSDVSHQLRNPIANIGLNLELLDYVGPEKRQHHLDIVRQEIGQMGKLVDEILELSRLDRRSIQAKFQPEDLNLLVNQVLAVYESRAEAAGLLLLSDLAEDLPPVLAVPHYLEQVLINLLSNAIDYTPTGHIYVRTYLDEQHDPARAWIGLQVRDTGIGIAPDDFPHLFERFYRGQRAQHLDIPGNGLGLAIVKEIVTLHRGEIAVDSQEGEGTTFSVWLPPAA